MKPLWHNNRILMLGLAVSILLHGLLLLLLPESTFLTGRPSDIRSDMELRFVLRDHFPKASVSPETAVAIEGPVPENREGTVSSGESMPSESPEGIDRPGRVTPSSSGKPVMTGGMPSSRQETGYQASTGQTAPDEGEDSRSVVFRRGAGRQAAQTGRPVITASTRDPVYAMYFRALRSRIEHLGNINFPQRNGVRLYGELTVRIPVNRNGTIDDREGGVAVERSSGNHDLDNAALGIVRRAAPFGPFPRNAQTSADVWVIITRLKFTRDQGYRPQIQATVR